MKASPPMSTAADAVALQEGGAARAGTARGPSREEPRCGPRGRNVMRGGIMKIVAVLCFAFAAMAAHDVADAQGRGGGGGGGGGRGGGGGGGGPSMGGGGGGYHGGSGSGGWSGGGSRGGYGSGSWNGGSRGGYGSGYHGNN